MGCSGYYLARLVCLCGARGGGRGAGGGINRN